MKKSAYLFILLSIFFGILSCNSEYGRYTISVTNHSDLKRDSETIEIHFNQLPGFSMENASKVWITDQSGKRVLTQFIDYNSDSIAETILFQSDFDALETKPFTLLLNGENATARDDSIRTFCRFVPERIDDFAWENDRVAFRTYGPKCQQMFESGIPGGLISSGIDCWLKRVDYQIINKWYNKNSTGGSYHIDTGEGLDNYHVGTSRGCGGTAILSNETFVLSKNFRNWKIIANGPIRSVFELEYPSYDAGGLSVRERKTFTIDLGTNFYRCDIKYESSELVEQAAIGIAHHEKEGEINFSKAEGWLSYWEPLDDSFLGTAIIVDAGTLKNSEIISKKDDGNYWIILTTNHNSFSYWAGFGWEKSGQFSSPSEWKKFVKKQATVRKIPLTIQIDKI